MTSKLVSSGNNRHASAGISLFIGLALVLVFFGTSATIAFFNISTLQKVTNDVSHTHEVTIALEDLVSFVKDAETGQRGYVITGEERYLEPYTFALAHIEERVEDVRKLTADNPDHQAQLPEIQAQIDLKLKELAESITVRRAEGFEAARAIVVSDRGKASMDRLRDRIVTMQQDERKLRKQRLEERDIAFRAAVQSGLVSALVGGLLAVVVSVLLRRTDQARWRQEWLQTGQAGLSAKLIGEQRLDVLGDNALQFLCEYLGAQAGAIFIEDGSKFRRCATYAVPSSASLPESFAPGDGLLGQAVKDARPFLVRDVPMGYLKIGSALGKNPPRHMLIAPALIDGGVNAVVELGFFEPVPEASIELLIRTAESIGVAVNSAKSRARILELLEETQRQSEEVQAQSEELRVSNEELEEQSQALQKTQSQLENQQAELEQTNLHLEAQARLLEAQKDDLVVAKLDLESQARVVEQASQYKSAFLANMSHELRTPLNSSLILSQLLAENRHGNLTEEQIKYARTIQSSGNDLLALINDVLDLSKIEAGRMDLTPQRINITQLLETLRSQFEPVASNRGLALQLTIAPKAPQSIETDPHRLEQVLRNLLSNALKFTEKGEVAMEVAAAAQGRVSFAVRDTGIGIEAEQQRLIFEPFCQADGTTSRKYGGTGLGLSISRELARLLGGEIVLTSQIGRGSVFTVILPQTLKAAAPEAEPAPVTYEPASTPSPASLRPSAPSAPSKPVTLQQIVADDREKLSSSKQMILVIEDDASFAEILTHLAHEQNFQCLVTSSAHEALELAREHLPSAVVLDVGLPDGSGLFVLDRLKHDARTRHIPVHVVSGSDYAEKALAMGAAGYMLKPVPREKLADAFQALEKRLTHRLRRVLVVEDDPIQLGALCSLLSSREVEAIGAQDAAGCLEQLQGDTFDCMVLDLSLPDASGFALLEKISADESYPFPPVIIYTGRELSADEEQRLRRYSKSIIVKGAKSPERLLDEVALFLHQVVSELPAEQQRMIEKARSREAALEGRRVLLAEDDVRNIFALTSLLEPLGLILEIARNGREALEALERTRDSQTPIDLVLMDIMMPEMDGLTAMRAIREKPEWKKLPIIALTAKAMPADQQQCLAAGANDYLAKPLNVEKLLSLVRVWMPR
ncbi:GAF domain-containing protein [Prosthecobacter fusiformis]|uniref:histidine kinase n=1 Tax=Prosthecobacter fusiformis TaxID=48464 RepID=A0A4R7S1D7_9BACT|nr:response regulator [Prosthecobacter fusiformis]TDU71306.1 GAF domain-containing protein [Prosthecobacter fusiformis]